ncbi:concanavalin A-like lectin/glucanase [Trametes coccinea BRFM310]|uniref:Concanavalin A-like lectin/glucanase n=1 Tax=Trametes coccinea (strain BRFM310) TaxID=1353009 RepID=A0A1Y2IKR1_TRAC3|nr:concanavalin A-like lectin/glucanase [Trametes coccinea BRFM310]
MRLISTLAFGFLALTSALARPSTFVERAVRRGRPALPAASLAEQKPSPVSAASSAHPTTRSSNWAGVVLPSPPQGENFTVVQGTFAVPALAPSSYAAASIWVGVDGWQQSADAQGLFQAGVDCWVEDGETTYDAWYEWVPDGSYNFTGFAVSAGDVLTYRLVAASEREGTIYVENETTGEAVTRLLAAPPLANSQLALQSVEWIMEDFFWYGQVPLANFGSIHFTNTSAKTGAGTTVGLSNATIIDLVLSGDDEPRTATTIDSDSSATISYVS